MYEIRETSYGIHVVFDGFLQKKEMESWRDDVLRAINGRRGEFGALADLRAAKAFPADAQLVLFEAIRKLRARGMGRQAVIVTSPITKIQATRTAKTLDMYDAVRFLDASSVENWEKLGVDWVAHGIDPD